MNWIVFFRVVLGAALLGTLLGCGGGGAGGPATYSISLRADMASLPLNISGVQPSIGGPYTTTLYVSVEGSDGKPIAGGADNVQCSYVAGLDSGPLYYLDGDPEHETKETVDGVEVVTPTGYRSVTLSTNAGLATLHFHATNVAGAAIVRCSIVDPSSVVRSAEYTIQVGGAPSGKASQLVISHSSANYLYIQGVGGPTQSQLQASLVDEAGQLFANPPPGVNNVQLRIVPDPNSPADDNATLRGVNGNGQAVAGATIHVASINGQAQFTLVSGTAPGQILIEALADRNDNNVSNGVSESIYNYVAVSAVVQAPTQTGTQAPLAISTDGLPEAVREIPYGVLLEASGGAAPYTWSLLTPGSLPAGLSLNTTGIISGTPSSTSPGTYNFVVQLRDAQGTTIQKSLAIAYTSPEVTPVPSAPTITSTTLSAGTVGKLYNSLATASGGNTPYSWSVVSGTLPPGLSLSSTGVVSGIPNAAGSYTFVLTVTGGGLSSSRSVTMTVNPASSAAPAILTVSLPTAELGEAYAAQLNAVGGATPYSWSASQLPDGLVLNSATGVISGTPAGAGTFTFTVTVTGGGTTTKDFTLTINP